MPKTLPGLLAALLTFLLSLPAFAGSQVGTLTAVQGEVKLFYNPSAKLDGPPPHALFEGVYYSVRDAKVGDHLEKGTIIRTHPGARARVIFENGDQFHVAPGSSFSIDWDHDNEQANATMNLRYGKARAVIEKGGPRSHLMIRTKSATMGVRGTDFFIAVNGQTGATETATMRGSVQVTSRTASGADAGAPIEVKTGDTASAPLATDDKPAVVELHRTTEPELKVIQRTSVVKNETPATSDEVAREIRTLESAAATTTLGDIRKYDPELYARLMKQGEAGTMDTYNLAVLDELLPSAPKEQAHVGPITDLAGTDDAVGVPVTIVAPTPPAAPAVPTVAPFDDTLPLVHVAPPSPNRAPAAPSLLGPRPASSFHFVTPRSPDNSGTNPGAPGNGDSSDQDDDNAFRFKWGTWNINK